MKRQWCSECGCGLFIKPSTKPEMTGVKAGLFDPKDVPAPTHEVFLQDMQVRRRGCPADALGPRASATLCTSSSISWEKTAPSAQYYERNLDLKPKSKA